MAKSMDYGTSCKSFQEILPSGLYRFEVWGAQGGSYNGQGGKGGYAKGEVCLTSTTLVFINIGGKGDNTQGGCNGGGKSVSYSNSGGGGTDIRISQNNLNNRIIVAGGGGGSGTGSGETGGYGGGTKGGKGIYSSDSYPGIGGTERAPGTTCADGTTTACPSGSFGYGGNSSYSSAGAGGGGWFGGSASRDNDPGGGGSGFVYVSGAYVPSDFNLSTNYYLKNSQLLGGDQSIPDFDKSGSFVTGRSGDGAARITLLIPSATMGPTIAASKKFQLRNTCEPLKQKQTLDRPSLHYTLISTLLNEGLSKTLADLFKWQIDK